MQATRKLAKQARTIKRKYFRRPDKIKFVIINHKSRTFSAIVGIDAFRRHKLTDERRLAHALRAQKSHRVAGNIPSGIRVLAW